MTGNLALYLWVLLPSFFFVVLVGYMVVIGRGPGGEKFDSWKGHRRGASWSRPALLVNLVSRDRAVDAVRSVQPEVVIEAASHVALGPQRPQAR